MKTNEIDVIKNQMIFVWSSSSKSTWKMCFWYKLVCIDDFQFSNQKL